MPRPEQPRGERLRPKSQENRLIWRPSDPHAMDALDKEVQTLDVQIPEQISHLLAQVTHTQQRLQAILEHEHYQQSPHEMGHIYTISLGLRDDYPPFPFTPA